tara:strand:+ start:3017 stop:6097 length:3081 start_codon:yes stop_codon:yes gene_type:complete
MAKEIYEITKFVTGTVSNIADRDIPDDAASYSKNLDPTSVSGQLQAIKADVIVQDGSSGALGKGTNHAFINNGGNRDLVWYDPDNNHIKYVTDLYGSKGDVTIATGGSSITSGDDVTFEQNNREIHIGTGNGSSHKPKWAGYIPHGQFTGSAPSGIQVEDANLLSPGRFPAMFSVCEDENYIYGVEYQGQYIYKFQKSDYSLLEISKTRFVKLQVVALAGDVANYGKTYSGNHLWVYDSGHSTYGTIYKVDRATLSIVQENQLTAAICGGVNYVTSMVESTNMLWAASHPTDGGYITANSVFRVATPTSTTSITFTNASPWAASAGTGESSLDGDYFSSDLNSDATAPTTARFYTVRNSLCLSAANTAEVCWFTRITNATGAAVYMAYYQTGGVNHAYPLGQCAWIIKESYTQVSQPADNNTVTKAYPVTFEVGVSNSLVSTDVIMDTLQQKAANGFIAKLFISHHPTGNTDNMKISQYPLITQHSSYNGIFSSTSAGQTNRIDADHVQYVPTEGAVVQSLLTGQNTNGSSQAVAGYKLNIFGGSSYGAWAIVDGDLSSNSGYKLRSTLEMSIATSGTNTEWNNSYTYFYACSFVYDGYQESPLSSAVIDSSNQTKNRSITLKIFNLADSSSSLAISKRITHINLYRSEAVTANATFPTGFYRLVKSQKLDSSFAAKSSAQWGNYKEVVITDDKVEGASYEAYAGLPETIDRTLPHYALSTQLNNEMIIGKCYHPDIENSENYLFKSLPYKYDTFDWTSDLLRLPIVPTALASFQGKVYAFSENDIYIINTQGMYIEDILEGMGCLNKHCVKVTDYGMCFADINNIYLHDGRQASPIGQTILNEKAEQTGWLFKNTSTDPLVFFEGSTKSFVIYFQKQAGNGSADHLAWAYNVLRRRWDLWYGPTAGAVGGIVGKNGEMLINDGTNLRHMKGDSNYANWEFRTKNITLGASTQEKMFYKIRTVGDTGCEIAYSVDGGAYTSDVTSTNSVDISAANKKKKALKIRLKGTGSEIIDSVGVVYRRLKVK